MSFRRNKTKNGPWPREQTIQSHSKRFKAIQNDSKKNLTNITNFYNPNNNKHVLWTCDSRGQKLKLSTNLTSQLQQNEKWKKPAIVRIRTKPNPFYGSTILAVKDKENQNVNIIDISSKSIRISYLFMRCKQWFVIVFLFCSSSWVFILLSMRVSCVLLSSFAVKSSDWDQRKKWIEKTKLWSEAEAELRLALSSNRWFCALN